MGQGIGSGCRDAALGSGDVREVQVEVGSMN